uniref:Glutathione S-transferase n=1 Tax=Tetraselmis sp. GSL018 TaxID=582737 RepID=A0A061RQW7_9CHLO
MARRCLRSKLSCSAQSSEEVFPVLDVENNMRPNRDRPLVFYSHMLCPFAQRVLLTLLEKGADFELVHLDLSSKPDWYREVNPRGLVPAVEFVASGRVEVESIDLCRLLDEELEGRVTLTPPAGSEARERMEALVGSCGKQQPRAYAAALGSLEEALAGGGGPFLAGQQLTLADLIYLPFVERADLIAREMHGLAEEDTGGRRTREWLETMRKRPSVTAASADSRLLLRAFQQHMCLDFFDYTTYDAAQLHPQNRIR